MNSTYAIMADLIRRDDAAGQSETDGQRHFALSGIDTGEGIRMRFSQCSYGRVPTEDVLAGKVFPVSIVVTSDGRGYRTDGWHSGPECGQLVFVERWTAEGREFHGWIDAESRKLVQAG